MVVDEHHAENIDIGRYTPLHEALLKSCRRQPSSSSDMGRILDAMSGVRSTDSEEGSGLVSA